MDNSIANEGKGTLQKYLSVVEVGASRSRQVPLPDLASCYEVTLCQEKFSFGHNCFLKVSGKSLVEQSPALATLLFVDHDIVMPTV